MKIVRKTYIFLHHHIIYLFCTGENEKKRKLSKVSYEVHLRTSLIIFFLCVRNFHKVYNSVICVGGNVHIYFCESLYRRECNIIIYLPFVYNVDIPQNTECHSNHPLCVYIYLQKCLVYRNLIIALYNIKKKLN